MEREPISPLVNEPRLVSEKTMFRKGPLDPQGHNWGMHVDDNIELQFDGLDHHYACPHCHAHNVVSGVGMGHRISYVKKSK